jgi:hypothetical protein
MESLIHLDIHAAILLYSGQLDKHIFTEMSRYNS